MATVSQTEDLRALVVRHCRSALDSDFAGKVAETYLTRVFTMGIALVTTVIVARLLGPTGRGYYAVATATGALGVQFGTVGLHAANSYYVAKQPESLRLLLGNTWAVSFGLGGLIALVTGAILSLRPDLIGLRGPTLLLALLWIPFGLGYTLMQSLMLGLHDIRGFNWAEVGIKLIPLLLIGILVVAHRVGVASFFSTAVLAMACGCIWLGARLRKRSPGRPQLSWQVFRDSIQVALRAYLIATFCFLVLRADLLMIQHMLGSEQAGYYSIASTMADCVAIIAAVIGLILFPKLAALTDVRKKIELTQKATIWTGFLLLPLVVVSSLLAHPVVRILFGPLFLPASLSFVLLMPGMLFLGLHSVAVQFLNSIGYPKSVVVIWAVCSGFNIAVNLAVIPQFGIAGAAVVSSISYGLAFLSVMWFFYRTGRQLERVAA